MIELLTTSHCTRGWDLPEEILHAIMSSVNLKVEEQSNPRDTAGVPAKHALVAPSLVNKYWSAAIRPLLFRNLELRCLEDALFLQNIARSRLFATSGLASAIQVIGVRYYTVATMEKHWVYHIHWLMYRLPHTLFVWHVGSGSDDPASKSSPINPYAVIPSVPSSFLRPWVLFLHGVRFANSLELVKLIDSFHTLEYCRCRNLSFTDSSLYVPPRWRQRQSATQRPLRSFSMAATEGMTLRAQAALVSDILRVSPRLSLDDGSWRAVLGAIVALVPDTWDNVDLDLKYSNYGEFDQVDIGFSELSMPSDSECDVAYASIYICGPDADSQPASTDIRKIELAASLPGMQASRPSALDALHSEHPAVMSNLEELTIRALRSRKGDISGMTNILCAVLRRTQLSWALDSRRLRFERYLGVECDVVHSEDILSMPAEHIVDGMPVVLDVHEQAEWLLRFSPDERNAYVRQIVAQRAAVSAHPSSIAPAGAVIKQAHERKTREE